MNRNPHKVPRPSGDQIAPLGMELVVVLLMFFPRRVRLICFLIVTPWELAVILTANYTFLNYLVLSLGFLLLDDRYLARLAPARWRPHDGLPHAWEENRQQPFSIQASDKAAPDEPRDKRAGFRLFAWRARLGFSALMLTWIFYATTAEMIGIPFRELPLPTAPIAALEPFRIANQYGLFAVMTRGRYEIEFQGSADGHKWTPYLFGNKPQLLNEAPRIYAPYQPRFDWNLWFASLGGWRQNTFVAVTEERLLTGSPAVLSLFRENPFPHGPPRYVRAVLWQYWFTSAEEKKATGNWWKRQYLGLYAPELTMENGKFAVVEWPEDLAPRE